MEKLLFDMRQEQYEQIRALARKGAKVLDQMRPTWFNEVYLELLHMAGSLDCVLGQLYGQYVHGAVEVAKFLGSPDFSQAMIEHGFTAVSSQSITGDRLRDLALLTLAWTDEIEERRRERS